MLRSRGVPQTTVSPTTPERWGHRRRHVIPSPPRRQPLCGPGHALVWLRRRPCPQQGHGTPPHPQRGHGAALAPASPGGRLPSVMWTAAEGVGSGGAAGLVAGQRAELSPRLEQLRPEAPVGPRGSPHPTLCSLFLFPRTKRLTSWSGLSFCLPQFPKIDYNLKL